MTSLEAQLEAQQALYWMSKNDVVGSVPEYQRDFLLSVFLEMSPLTQAPGKCFTQNILQENSMHPCAACWKCFW